MAGVGIGMDCTQGKHHTCAEVGCRCRCHLSAKDLIERQPSTMQIPDPPPTPSNGSVVRPAGITATKVCPSCGNPERIVSAKFCRRCGSELVESLFCASCQSVVISGDAYCWSCGGKQ